jgi:hypothetical protein
MCDCREQTKKLCRDNMQCSKSMARYFGLDCIIERETFIEHMMVATTFKEIMNIVARRPVNFVIYLISITVTQAQLNKFS